MKVLVTGCAGFIGSNLVDRLLHEGHTVVGLDNFSTGRPEFLEGARRSSAFALVECDLTDGGAIVPFFEGCDLVFHFAANADVRFGTDRPSRDLEQNTFATFNVLEAMRKNKVMRLAFSSTGSVYGEAKVFPTPEDAPFPVQTSLYGASKLACEGLIAAYSEGFGLQSWIFRFVSILGERYTHGHVFDFYKQLKKDPSRLRVLGNGKQRKSYLHVQDCLDAMFLALQRSGDRVNIFNLGVDGYCQVIDSIGWITRELGLEPELDFTGGERGWIGDNPFIFLDNRKICSLGWSPANSIEQGVVRTVKFLADNEWVLEARD